MTGRQDTSDGARVTLILLGLVVLILLALVVVKYWPPWITDLGDQAVDWAVSNGGRLWRRTGGRWVTLFAVVAISAVGLLLMRRHRTLGLSLIELSVAAGAIVALVQPEGW